MKKDAIIAYKRKDTKWAELHTLTNEQQTKLISNKLERAIQHMEARKRISKSFFAD